MVYFFHVKFQQWVVNGLLYHNTKHHFVTRILIGRAHIQNNIQITILKHMTYKEAIVSTCFNERKTQVFKLINTYIYIIYLFSLNGLKGVSLEYIFFSTKIEIY